MTLFSSAQARHWVCAGQVRQTRFASPTWRRAAPVVPIGKNRSGSASRQAASSRQSARAVMELLIAGGVSRRCGGRVAGRCAVFVGSHSSGGMAWPVQTCGPLQRSQGAQTRRSGDRAPPLKGPVVLVTGRLHEPGPSATACSLSSGQEGEDLGDGGGAGAYVQAG